MPNKNKALGSSLETRAVERAQAKGLEASKQPGSGVFKAFPHDAVVEGRLVECKVRSAELDAENHRIIRVDFDWLLNTIRDAERAGFSGAVLVFNAKGSREPLACITYTEYLNLLKAAKGEPVEPT